MKTLETEFGPRLVKLCGGKPGIRAGLTCEVKALTGSEPVMDFIASTNQVDRYNEVINQDGWQMDNFLANPVVPDCHDYSSVSKILGRDILPKDQQVQGGKLGARILFATDNPMGSLAFKLAQGGFLKSMSVGFIPLTWTNGTGADAPDRTYTKSELLEKSLVVIPANPGATIGNQIKSVLSAGERRDLADWIKQICSEPSPGAPNAPAPAISGAALSNLVKLLRG